MKIVYLIGNGFDMNIGMKTQYIDFYNYYLSLPKENDVEVIKTFKSTLKRNLNNWSDLEYELGIYLNRINISKDAITLHEDLIEKLQGFFEEEEKKYHIDDTQKERLFNYLSRPFDYGLFTKIEHDKIQEIINEKGKDIDWDVKIITFNYTRTIERMVGLYNLPVQIGCYENNNILLSEIVHIHGYANNRMILGVNDNSQIANENLKKDSGVSNRYVKINCNRTYGTDINDKCEQWVSEANIVCLFGLSLGDTDKKWWQLLINKFIYGNLIFLFNYYEGKKPDYNQGVRRSEIMEEIKNNLLLKIDFKDDFIKEGLNINIMPTFSDEMFKFEILTENEFNGRF